MLIVGNGFVIESLGEKKYIPNGAVAVEGGVILETGECEQIKAAYPDADFIDAKGGIITTGFIDAHTRFMSVYEKKAPVGTFIDVQKKIRWKTDRKLTLDAVKAGAAAAATECIANGITTAFNMHASYGAIEGSLAAVSEACENAGIWAYSSYEVSDRDGSAITEAALAEAANGKITGCDAMFNVSEETLNKVANIKKGIHISAGECDFDENTAWRKHQMSVVERLDSAAALDMRSIAAHCNLISEDDMEILKTAGASAVLCPAADEVNHLPEAPAKALLAAGVTTGIGTDGRFNMLAALRAYARLFSDKPYGGAEQALAALAANADILEKITGEDKKSIASGQAADIIVIGKKPYSQITEENIAEYIVYEAEEITDVVCDGRILKRGGELDTSAYEAAEAERVLLYERMN